MILTDLQLCSLITRLDHNAGDTDALRLAQQLTRHSARIRHNDIDRCFEALIRILESEIARLLQQNYVNGINMPSDLARLFSHYVMHFVADRTCPLELRHRLAASLSTRLVVAMANSPSPVAWTRWVADTDPEDMLHADTALIAALKAGIGKTKNLIRVPNLEPWLFREFSFSSGGRAIFASRGTGKRPGYPEDLRTQSHAVIFIESSHVRARPGQIINAYRQIIVDKMREVDEEHKPLSINRSKESNT